MVLGFLPLFFKTFSGSCYVFGGSLLSELLLEVKKAVGRLIKFVVVYACMYYIGKNEVGILRAWASCRLAFMIPIDLNI